MITPLAAACPGEIELDGAAAQKDANPATSTETA